MITDNQNFIRELGLRQIMAAIARKSIGIRKFTIPDFNFEAEDYHELTDWQNWEKTEPPLTMGISDEVLKQMVVDGVLLKCLISKTTHVILNQWNSALN
ncbi:hypothetical protein AVEN_186278-1 [Araneus ventricosus]|uniref:Uncharacterized protein n=1 Tax=Araneus ventricosus TaxID=182803 RepID=A0A4Y2P200_ARAVE|nr:hypothetical protein AVEN_186278-1 [Araneus ventricosus]